LNPTDDSSTLPKTRILGNKCLPIGVSATSILERNKQAVSRCYVAPNGREKRGPITPYLQCPAYSIARDSPSQVVPMPSVHPKFASHRLLNEDAEDRREQREAIAEQAVRRPPTMNERGCQPYRRP
jgi:hypothetical protein